MNTTIYLGIVLKPIDPAEIVWEDSIARNRRTFELELRSD